MIQISDVETKFQAAVSPTITTGTTSVLPTATK